MKKAFTLAEVLITLGIIGVVAAMTMPTLIQSYQKKVWAIQLKKSVNIIQNSIKMINTSEEVDEIYNSSYAEMNYRSENMGYMIMYKLLPDKISEFLKWQPVSQKTKFFAFINKFDNFSAFMLKDGSCIAIDNSRNGLNVFTGVYESMNIPNSRPRSSFLIDINCDKGPNKAGRDRFIFEIDGYGLVYKPVDIDNITTFCKTEFNHKGSDDWSDEEKEFFNLYMESARLQCGYAVLLDGWEMNY